MVQLLEVKSFRSLKRFRQAFKHSFLIYKQIQRFILSDGKDSKLRDEPGINDGQQIGTHHQ